MKNYAQCHIPILPVKNFKESIAYYRDVLGFEIAWIWDEDGYGAVKCGQVEIHLDRQEHVTPSQSYLFVERADDVYAYLKSQGVAIVREIESKPWGVKEFTFKDLDGHLFRVAQSEH